MKKKSEAILAWLDVAEGYTFWQSVQKLLNFERLNID